MLSPGNRIGLGRILGWNEWLGLKGGCWIFIVPSTGVPTLLRLMRPRFTHHIVGGPGHSERLLWSRGDIGEGGDVSCADPAWMGMDFTRHVLRRHAQRQVQTSGSSISRIWGSSALARRQQGSATRLPASCSLGQSEADRTCLPREVPLWPTIAKPFGAHCERKREFMLCVSPDSPCITARQQTVGNACSSKIVSV